MKIAYSPFNDAAHVNAIKANIRDFHRGWFSPLLEKFDQVVRTYDGVNMPLIDVRADQQLYVFGHGDVGSDELECMDGSTITLDHLARRMRSDGLGVGHQVVKLFACNGGQGGNNSMAAKLKLAMVQAGFTSITVYGYTESMAIATKGKVQQKYSADTGARAKDVRKKF